MKMARRTATPAGGGRPRMMAGTLWLRKPPSPAAAWNLLAALRAAGSAYTPVWFRATGMATARMLRRRSEPLAVEYLAQGEEIELLRRAGSDPRTLLHSAATNGIHLIHFYGPALGAVAEGLSFIQLVKAICDTLRPVAGVFDERDGGDEGTTGGGSGGATAAGAIGDETARDKTMLGAPVSGNGLPGWLTALGGDKVLEVGAGRLLMAPVYLIDTLEDGGLLIAATPLPRDVCAHAGRRSAARWPHLQGREWWAGAPLLDPEEWLTLT